MRDTISTPKECFQVVIPASNPGRARDGLDPVDSLEKPDHPGRDAGNAVGIDVTYIGGSDARQTEDSTLIDGVPTLVVEILSPSDTIEDINEKIDAYLAARVSIIWIIDPYRRTITVHQPDSVPKLFNVRDELSAEPHLPGFRIPVAKLFQ